MADQDNIGQILVLDDADHVLNMRVEIDLTAEEVFTLADAGQRRSIDFMPRLTQPWRQLPPENAAGPRAMHQDERRHPFLPRTRPVVCWSLGLKRQNDFCRREHVWQDRVDRASEVAADRQSLIPTSDISLSDRNTHVR